MFLDSFSYSVCVCEEGAVMLPLFVSGGSLARGGAARLSAVKQPRSRASLSPYRYALPAVYVNFA